MLNHICLVTIYKACICVSTMSNFFKKIDINNNFSKKFVLDIKFVMYVETIKSLFLMLNYSQGVYKLFYTT
jgi:hypothetical protein